MPTNHSHAQRGSRHKCTQRGPYQHSRQLARCCLLGYCCAYALGPAWRTQACNQQAHGSSSSQSAANTLTACAPTLQASNSMCRQPRVAPARQQTYAIPACRSNTSHSQMSAEPATARRLSPGRQWCLPCGMYRHVCPQPCLHSVHPATATAILHANARLLPFSAVPAVHPLHLGGPRVLRLCNPQPWIGCAAEDECL